MWLIEIETSDGQTIRRQNDTYSFCLWTVIRVTVDRASQRLGMLGMLERLDIVTNTVSIFSALGLCLWLEKASF